MNSPRLLAAFALIVLAAGCYTNPVTGRQYAVLVPAGQEVAMGEQAFAEVKQQEKVSTNPILNTRVNRVGQRIAEAIGNDLPGAQWEFVVFESKELNAFALPGGKVGVYTGLLELAESDSELAIVMGHEIGHVVARHGGKRMTEGIATAALGIAGAELVGAKYGEDKRDAFLLAYGGISTLGFVLPHSRADETEADQMGLLYAAKAGYDPGAAITFWERMSAAKNQSGGVQIPAILSSHPSDEQRIANLRVMLPQFIPIYEQAVNDRLDDGKTE
jgi:predicted Zn-dependent protease